MNSEPFHLEGDRPRVGVNSDEFGLSNMVSAVADGLLTQIGVDGYVIGVEGRWGSGKSTFINFLKETISKKDDRLHIISFEPWLIDHRDALLPYFFSILSGAIQAVDSRRWDGKAKKAAKKIARNVLAYGKLASKLAAPVKAAAILDPSGKVRIVSAILHIVELVVGLFERGESSLEELKQKIERDLSRFGRKYTGQRFLMVIDDLDRLEPSEAVEILRLVAKVGNFPLLTYVMCFDLNVLSGQVEEAIGVDDGRAYLQKIVQNFISIPPYEPFALRRYLRSNLTKSFPEEMSRTDEAESNYVSRRHYLIDVWADRLLHTPRDIMRLCDAVKFGWGALRGRVDFIDYVWLQMIRLNSDELYNWVRTYVSGVGAYRDNGRASDDEPARMAEELEKIMKGLRLADIRDLSGISQFLPGVGSYLLDGEKRRVFQFSSGDLVKYESNGRLGSPSHWRRYFAFTEPSYVVGDDTMENFRKLLRDDVSAAGRLLLELARKPHAKTGHFAEYLLDRLYDQSGDNFSNDEMKNLAILFSDVMDELARIMIVKENLGPTILDTSGFILAKKGVIDVGNIFEEGRSVNWLASTLRHQAASYGIPEGREIDESVRWLSRDQVQNAIRVLVERFKKLGLEIFDLPEPLDILYCWNQVGDEHESRTFVADLVKTTEGFLRVLNGLRGVVHSSTTGIYHPLRVRQVSSFLDPDMVKKRLFSIAGSTTESDDMRRQASDLLDAWSEKDY